jgi:hypothetical protein
MRGAISMTNEKPASPTQGEAIVSIIARAIRQSLKDYGHQSADSSLPEYIAADVAYALPAPTQGELAVKELEWDEIDERLWGAQPFHGFCYEIRVTDRGGTRVRWPENGGWESFNGTLEDAKAVAQADFEARIRSALVNGGEPC